MAFLKKLLRIKDKPNENLASAPIANGVTTITEIASSQAILSEDAREGFWFYSAVNRFEYYRVIREPSSTHLNIRIRGINHIIQIQTDTISRGFSGRVMDMRQTHFASEEINQYSFSDRYRRIQDRILINELERRYQEEMNVYGERLRRFENELSSEEVEARNRANEFLGRNIASASSVVPAPSSIDRLNEMTNRLRRNLATTQEARAETNAPENRMNLGASISGTSIMPSNDTIDRITEPEIENKENSVDVDAPIKEIKLEKTKKSLDEID